MTAWGKRNIITLTIPNGGTTSTPADLQGFVLSAIDFPAMTGTSVTFEGATPSDPAITAANAVYKPIASSADANLSVTVSATAKIRAVDPSNFAGVTFLRLVSGASEGAARTINLIAYEA